MTGLDYSLILLSGLFWKSNNKEPKKLNQAMIWKHSKAIKAHYMSGKYSVGIMLSQKMTV